jgi:hypothetical protein
VKHRVARLAALLVLTSGCIIPDREIDIEPLDDNQFAVRIVQPTPLLSEMLDVCTDDESKDPELSRAHCPQVPDNARPSGLITPEPGNSVPGFCTCPGAGSRDGRRIDSFIIWAEDGDRDGGEPKDTLFGAALLDPDPGSSFQGAVAYRNYWDPSVPATRVDVTDVSDDLEPSVGRADNGLWGFRLREAGSNEIDLCNDDDEKKVAAGIHALRFIVTDRPFFQAELPPLAESGPPMLVPQPGVPDLAAGATYAIVDFVFECRDPVNDPESCAAVPPGDPIPPECCDCLGAAG